MDPTDARELLLSADKLERNGIADSQRRRAVRSGALVVVHRGRYVAKETWEPLFSEDRHLLRVLAAEEFRRGSDIVFSHASAAAVWGLPLFRHSPGAPHISTECADGRVGASRSVRRHEIAVAEADRTIVDGIPTTSLHRTVYDVIRTTPREAALACADAALRTVAWDDSEGTYDEQLARDWRAGLLARVVAGVGARGIRQARFIARFADGRAQLPGESVSRLYLHDLGFAPPRLQVPVAGPRGRDYRVDMGLDDAGVWGEFDGVGKYFDPELDDLDARGRILREKEREDWIRGRTGRPVIRWGMTHLEDAATLGRHLAAFGVRPRR